MWSQSADMFADADTDADTDVDRSISYISMHQSQLFVYLSFIFKYSHQNGSVYFPNKDSNVNLCNTPFEIN